MNVIPAIDLKDGNCVRLFQGDFNRQTHYHSDPTAIARGYENMGCSDLHLVDLDGAKSGAQRNRALVEDIVAASSLAVQLGGGIRERESVRDWFAAGVHRLVIGSLAIVEPARVKDWMTEFGADRFVLALDCRCDDSGTPWLTTHGWTRMTKLTLWDCIEQFKVAGLQQVLCTDVSRDGAMSGPSIALYQEFVSRFPDIALQASGGVRDLNDLQALRKLGASAAITGRALLDGCITPAEILSFQQSA
ncbi:MAG: 1-(5-phosphoribosyl)-5-[(5-phosphoribosylamino)methylideneamino]imidazole-4-carboxamide isomerase [Woeseia sp.]